MTSLFKLVESMQRSLEAEGLDSAVVDVAVTRGLQKLLGRRASRGSEHAQASMLLSNFAGPALA